MLDIGWTELLVIAVVLIVVVGPKDLPPMIRAFGKMTKRLRQTAGEFRSQFDEALREAELDDLKKSVDDIRSLNPTNSLREAINPLRQMGQDIKSDLQKASRVDAPAAVSQKPATASDVAGTPVVEHSILPDLVAPTPPPADLVSVAPVAATATAPATSSPAGIDQPVKKTVSRKKAPTTTDVTEASVTVAKSPKVKRAATTASPSAAAAAPKGASKAATKALSPEIAGPKTAEPVAAVTQAGTVAAPAAPRKPRKTKSEDRA
ncbi:Sec-independent protein translocase protein tatB-like protein [Rhizobium sp. PDO1-076]|uniref:Sec-independent protein translocase protein TatB n=1 Tax=Rhizobium sp. PDO1-076 TaxID=1125979 RepID=UPI00024E3313|nr:Sec-independent protein translocase protein TatB [Rhizobium sp. PDO1-076]EHS49038.1 Sec-independent protein translocase protein tatB-like protein [Rhizobium sp. PDO1-076]